MLHSKSRSTAIFLFSPYRYDPKLVEDVKVLLKILYLFIPMPVFWALFDQQGSRWTFQAARLGFKKIFGEMCLYFILPC